MSQQSSEPAGPAGDDWPDDLWPDDDDQTAAVDQWRPPGTPPGWPGGVPPKRRPSTAILAAVALVAVVAGAAIALGIGAFSGSPRAAPGTQASGPGQPGQGGLPAGGGLPYGNGQPGQGGQVGPGSGFPGGSGQTGQAFVIAKVIRVSATSITLGGPGRTITAGITGSTRVTGQVSAISGIKAGDEVSAQIAEKNGTATVTAIQYPAQFPSGGVPGG
jgi:hypothetical protein